MTAIQYCCLPCSWKSTFRPNSRHGFRNSSTGHRHGTFHTYNPLDNSIRHPQHWHPLPNPSSQHIKDSGNVSPAVKQYVLAGVKKTGAGKPTHHCPNLILHLDSKDSSTRQLHKDQHSKLHPKNFSSSFDRTGELHWLRP